MINYLLNIFNIFLYPKFIFILPISSNSIRHFCDMYMIFLTFSSLSFKFIWTEIYKGIGVSMISIINN